MRGQGKRAQRLAGQAQESLLSPLQYLLFAGNHSISHQHLAIDYGAVHTAAHTVDQMEDHIALGAEPVLLQTDNIAVGLSTLVQPQIQPEGSLGVVCGHAPDLIGGEGGRGVVGVLLGDGPHLHLLE